MASFMISLGLLTPPVGLAAYSAATAAQHPVGPVFSMTTRFAILAALVVSLLMLCFPSPWSRGCPRASGSCMGSDEIDNGCVDAGSSRWKRGLASVGAGLCLLLMLLVTVASVCRSVYVLGTDLIPGAYNLIERVLFPLLIFWALPLVHREGAFPRLGVSDTLLPPRLRAWSDAGVLIVESLVFAVLTWYAGRFAWEAFQEGRQMQIGVVYWPLAPVLAMMPLAFGLMLAEMTRQAVDALRQAGGRAR